MQEKINWEPDVRDSIPEWNELQEFRRTHPPKTLEWEGARWEYLVGGQGEQVIVILPGLIGIAEMSFQQMRRLEDEYRVLVPSYPFEIKTIAKLVAGLKHVLEVENFECFHLLGGSYGGLIAQRLARACPERVDRLILSHTGGPKPERARQNRKTLLLFRILPMSMLRGVVRQSNSRSFADAPEVAPFWEAYTEEILTWLKKADLIARYQVAADFDATSVFSTDDLKDWPGKILILEGDNDPIAEAGDRQKLKELYPQASVHTFHGSGHIASIARVDEYVGVIKEFLKAG